MVIWILTALAVIVVVAEIVSSKQRAETDSKIDEMHKWMRKCHPYKFNGMSDRETEKIEYRNKDLKTQENERY